MLLTNDTFLTVDKPGLWIDSLHVQIVAGFKFKARLVQVWYTGSVFITNSVFQGDAEGQAHGFWCGGSVLGAYVQGVHID